MVAHFTLLALATSCAASFSGSAEISRVEGKVLAARRAIRQGHVVLESRALEVNNVRVHSVRTVYWDGAKLRGDEYYPTLGPGGQRTTPYTDISSFGDDVHTSYTTQPVPPGQTIVATVTDLKFGEGHLPEVVDPRWLGLMPWDSISLKPPAWNMEFFVGRQERKEPRMARATHKGATCWKIEYLLGDNPVRMWIDERKGWSVLRIEHAFSSEEDGGQVLDYVECDVRKHAGSGIWFPVSYLYQRVVNGEDVTREDRTDIRVVSLNQPLDPKLFSLAGMNVPAGHPVSLVVEGPVERMVWNGQAVVPETEWRRTSGGEAVGPDREAVGPDREAVGPDRRVLLLVAAVLAAVACCALWRYSRSKKRATHPF